jgi:hypothetical protein
MEKLNKTIDKNIPKSKPRNTKVSIPLSKETVQNIKRKHQLWESYMQDRSKEKHSSLSSSIVKSMYRFNSSFHFFHASARFRASKLNLSGALSLSIVYF